MRTLVVIFTIIVLAGCQITPKEDEVSTITISGKGFEVEVADTLQEKDQGLSGREDLGEDKGMLFVYEKEQRPEFWMKGMLLPLDFIWIKGNRVVDLHRNVQPEEVQPPETIIPNKEVDKVLEVNSGIIEEYDIKIGDRIHYNGGNS